MSQKLPLNDFEWVEDTSEVHVQYPEKLHELHNNLLFLPERMKTEKVEKLIANLHDKN